jgi:16S rRNA (guanine966-N2)-methyltransferase
MRVVGGIAKGTQLLSVPGDTTRPILDRVKTALFDILRPNISGAKVLDLFAGSGSVGIEALSQGATTSVFLDIEPKAITIIRKNLSATKFTHQGEVRCTDAFKYIRHTARTFDMVYIAPPQYKGIWVDMLTLISERPEVLSATGQLVVQIDPKENIKLELVSLVQNDIRTYGNTSLIFYQHRNVL